MFTFERLLSCVHSFELILSNGMFFSGQKHFKSTFINMFQARTGFETADICSEWNAEEMVFVKAVISDKTKVRKTVIGLTMQQYESILLAVILM